MNLIAMASNLLVIASNLVASLCFWGVCCCKATALLQSVAVLPLGPQRGGAQGLWRPQSKKTNSSFLLLVAMPGAPSSFLLLVAMPFAPSSFLLLVASKTY